MVATRTVTELLTRAVAIQTPRQTDLRLSAVERAQVGENVTRCNAALGDLNQATNLMPTNRRTGNESGLKDRVRATVVIDSKYVLLPAEFYNALDMMWDAADLIRDGQASTSADWGD